MYDRDEGMICIYELTEQFTLAPKGSYTLGTPFTLEFLVTKNSLSVSYNGRVMWQKTNLPPLSGKVYFKAGCYSQSSVLQFQEDPSEYSQNSIFDLDINHDAQTTAEIPAFTQPLPNISGNGTNGSNRTDTNSDGSKKASSAVGSTALGAALVLAMLMV